MENIKIQNAKEEIQEIVDKCNRCGLCKGLDPIFKVLREEATSYRGKSVLLSISNFDNSLFDDTLCGLCKESCPFDIDLDNAIRKARQILNLKNKELPKNKDILKKIKNKENPFV